MINFYKSVNDELVACPSFEEGAWVHMTNPTEDEVSLVCKATSIEADFVRPALDEEERPRIETDNGQTLILVDIPTLENDGATNVFSTIPLGIAFTKEAIVTVCLKETPILNDFINKRVKSFYTYFKSRFILQILFKSATLYLSYLRSIEKISNKIENDLQKSMKNKELAQLLKLEKSLVYFSTSLKSNESVLEKMLKLEAIKKFEEDQDLLEDVIIENKQAIEMTNIYSSILSGTMDAFASIISNNLNIVMKSLTIITIALSVPTAISGFFGMNVPNFWENSHLAFPIIVGGSVLLSAITSFLLLRRRLF
ncbi:magnesium transporter [Sporobacter termitidis DSM 10068]|uniref:Magnesium transporter n=1 Tax=Sporobacter termitidis DSM 10068 TaxID=1123282 RepID=A0A1M5TQZ7_9FIRM|nr:magnesium transporter CorA family protein [Sporobacter termitidis]SHH53119.1 magnesium transporter [Sporobacter termitidis DSM 10068]